MKGVARPSVGWRDQWQVGRDVTYDCVACRVSVLLSLPIGRSTTREPCLGDGRGASLDPNQYSTAGVHILIAVAVRRRVADDGGAGATSKAETDTVEPVVVAESVSCVEVLDRGVGSAMGVAAARSSAEPVPPSVGMANTEAKTVSAAGDIDPRPVQPSLVATEAETLATNLPGGAERPLILVRGSYVRKS